MSGPRLRHLLGSRENKWSDLLAALIETDPEPIGALIGEVPDSVRREVAVSGGSTRRSDQLDLLLALGGRDIAAIEVKLLSDLGRDQLARYEKSFPSAQSWIVLHLGRLPVNLRAMSPWKSLTWEELLEAHARSGDPWVAATATQWLDALDELIPIVDETTVWNDVPDDASAFELALRARQSWLSAQLGSWCELEHDLVQSSGGGTWAVRMWMESGIPDHSITAEMQEGLSATAWKPDPDRSFRMRMKGPVVLVGLRQSGIDTSANFNWSALSCTYATIINDAGHPTDGRSWRTNSARPQDPVDKENWQIIVRDGAPPWVGQGWGMRVAKSYGECLFGARFGLRPDLTLGEIDTELRKIPALLRSMTSRLARS